MSGTGAGTPDASAASPRRAAIVRIPEVAGDSVGPAAAAVLWAAARKMAAKVSGAGQDPVTAPAGWNDLLGRWVDKDDDGAIRGIVSFTAALGGRMLVRRGALVPRGGATHEDLMLITLDKDGRGARCLYQDSAGYLIDYVATWMDGGRGLELASVSGADEPRYRQAWRFDDPDTLHVTFEFAPPGGGPLVRHSEGPLKRAQPEA